MATMFTRRVVAYIIDFFVVSSVMWIVSYLFGTFLNTSAYIVYVYLPYVVPVLILAYCIGLEKTKGATVGKALMYLRVVSRNGYSLSWSQAIVRNLTKIYWFPVIFDWAIGRLLKRNDRILGVFTKTVVANEVA